MFCPENSTVAVVPKGGDSGEECCAASAALAHGVVHGDGCLLEHEVLPLRCSFHRWENKDFFLISHLVPTFLPLKRGSILRENYSLRP